VIKMTASQQHPGEAPACLGVVANRQQPAAGEQAAG